MIRTIKSFFDAYTENRKADTFSFEGVTYKKNSFMDKMCLAVRYLPIILLTFTGHFVTVKISDSILVFTVLQIVNAAVILFVLFLLFYILGKKYCAE